MKSTTLLPLLMLSMTTIPSRATACSDQPTTLAAMRDCDRPLLIFAPDATDARLTAQLAELRLHAANLRERDVRASVILPGPASVSVEALRGVPTATLTAAESARVVEDFKVEAAAFYVVLVGKDGGEKLRSETVLPIGKLDSTIDGMPMRQDEMKRKGQ